MRNLDFSSWESILSALLSIVLIAVIGVGIRLVMMMTIQQRRERMNRQINERLKLLIAAYKALGGSFTGSLEVDPTHLRVQRAAEAARDADPDIVVPATSDRTRRIRDSVEAALSDIILLGTEEHVRLAASAAADLAAGRSVHTGELVVSLRDFIRLALDLAPISDDIAIPPQGPARPGASKGGDRGGEARGGKGQGGMGGMGGGGGMGLGLGVGMGIRHADPD